MANINGANNVTNTSGRRLWPENQLNVILPDEDLRALITGPTGSGDNSQVDRAKKILAMRRVLDGTEVG